MPYAQGRGLRVGRVTLEFGEGGFGVRVDDADNPEFWLHVYFTRWEMEQILIEMVHESPKTEHLDVDPPYNTEL